MDFSKEKFVSKVLGEVPWIRGSRLTLLAICLGVSASCAPIVC